MSPTITVPAGTAISSPTGTTRLTLRGQVIANFEARTDLNTRIDTALNSACNDLTLLEWRELHERNSTLAMIAGTQSVDMSSVTDLLELKRLQYLNATNSYNLPQWTMEEAERRYPAEDQQANPTMYPEAYYREGQLLYLVPVPSVSYSLRLFYHAKLTLGTADTDTVSVAGFDELIVAYATADIYEAIEYGSKTAARWWASYERLVKRKMTSQRTGSGVVLRVQTGCGDAAEDPRIRDPRISWWPDGGQRGPGG